jgi:hypothetical protein
MQHLKATAGLPSVHHFNELQNTKERQLHYFLRGIGSVAVLMPGSTPLIRRSRVGSLNETGNRVAKTWSRAFVKAQE